MTWLPSTVYKNDINRVQSLVLEFVGRAQGDDLDIILDGDFNQQAVCDLLSSGAERINEVSFAIDWDVSDRLPRFTLELDGDAVAPT